MSLLKKPHAKAQSYQREIRAICCFFQCSQIMSLLKKAPFGS